MSSLRPTKRKPDDAGLTETQPRPSKRNFTFPVANSHSEDHDRLKSKGDLLESFDDLRLYTPPIQTLPQELLLKVFAHLVHPSLFTSGFPDKRVKHPNDRSNDEEELDSDGFGCAVDRRDLRNVCLVSRTFKMAATTLLYRCAHLATAKSPESLLSILMAHPELQPLVKHISIPTYVDRSTVAFNFAFSHDWLKVVKVDEDDMQFQYGNMSAKCAEIVEGGVLRRMVPLLPNLRTLIIPQLSFVGGPVIDGITLRNLTTLRITLLAPPEDIFAVSGFKTALRTLVGLRPEHLGHQYPALQRLEVCTATNTWEANLISIEGETDKCGCPLKYVASLKTTAMCPIAPAEWHLMTLERPIFDSSKLHTLEFAGPGSHCNMPCSLALNTDWDLNRFLSETGGGLRTLSLDWEVHHGEESNTQLSYFGPRRHLESLVQLTNLTHLTVSLQALFGNTIAFGDWVENMEDKPETELAKLFPPSLRTLRVAEDIQGMYEHDSYVEDAESEVTISTHSGSVYTFLQALRACWLLRAEGRELWFRRCAGLDKLADRLADRLGIQTSRTWLECILNDAVEKDGEFERVLHPPEDMEWGPQWNDSYDDDFEGEDGSEDSDADSSEDEEDEEDEDLDGGWDQGSRGEVVGVYQDGNFVLM